MFHIEHIDYVGVWGSIYSVCMFVTYPYDESWDRNCYVPICQSDSGKLRMCKIIHIRNYNTERNTGMH